MSTSKASAALMAVGAGSACASCLLMARPRDFLDNMLTKEELERRKGGEGKMLELMTRWAGLFW